MRDQARKGEADVSENCPYFRRSDHQRAAAGRHLRDRDGKSCCSKMDCQPAPYRLTADGVKMFVDGRWIHIPADRIQYRALLGDTGETGGGHWCGSGYEPGGYDPDVPYETICAILPPQAAMQALRPRRPRGLDLQSE